MQSSPFSKKKAFGLGLAGLAMTAGLKAAQPELGTFQDLPQGPVQTALEQNRRTARRVETSPGKYISEVFLDRLVNNGLAKPGNEATLKRVAIQQAQAVRDHLQASNRELTVENFESIRGSEELARTIADIERKELGVTALPDHTEIFFGPGSRAEKTKRQNERAVRSFNESGWRQAVAVESQHNFKAAEIDTEFASRAPETDNSSKSEAEGKPSPLIPVTLLTVAAGALSLGAFAARRYGHELGQRVRQTTAGWSKSDFFALKFPTFQAWGQKARNLLKNPFAPKATVASTPTQVARAQATQPQPVTDWDIPTLDITPFSPGDVLENDSHGSYLPSLSQFQKLEALQQGQTPTWQNSLDLSKLNALGSGNQKTASLPALPPAPNIEPTSAQPLPTTPTPSPEKTSSPTKEKIRVKAKLLRLQALIPRLEADQVLENEEADFLLLELDDLLHQSQTGKDVAYEVSKLSSYLRAVQETTLEKQRREAREQQTLQDFEAKLERVEQKIAKITAEVERVELARQERKTLQTQLLEYGFLKTIYNRHVQTLQENLRAATQDQRDQVFRAKVGVEYLTTVAEQLLGDKAQLLAKARTNRAEREARQQTTRDQAELARIEARMEARITQLLTTAAQEEAKLARSTETRERIAEAQAKYELLNATKDIFDKNEYEDLRTQLAAAYKSGEAKEVAFVIQSITDRAPEVLAERQAEKDQELAELLRVVQDFRTELDAADLSDARYQAYFNQLQTLTNDLVGRLPRQVRSEVVTLHHTLQQELSNPTAMTPNLNQPKPGLTPEEKAARRERIDLAQAEYKALREARTHLTPSAYAEYRRQLKEAFADEDKAKVKNISELITRDTTAAQTQAEQRQKFVEGIDFLDKEITEAQTIIGEDEATHLLEELRHIKANEDAEAFYCLQQEFDDLRNKQQSRTEYFTQPEKFGPSLSARPTVEPSIPLGAAMQPVPTQTPATVADFQKTLQDLKAKSTLERTYLTKKPTTPNQTRTNLDLPKEDFGADLAAIEDEYQANPTKFVAEATSFNTGEEFGPTDEELAASKQTLATRPTSADYYTTLTPEQYRQKFADFFEYDIKTNYGGSSYVTSYLDGTRHEYPVYENEQTEYNTIHEEYKNAEKIYLGDMGGYFDLFIKKMFLMECIDLELADIDLLTNGKYEFNGGAGESIKLEGWDKLLTNPDASQNYSQYFVDKFNEEVSLDDDYKLEQYRAARTKAIELGMPVRQTSSLAQEYLEVFSYLHAQKLEAIDRIRYIPSNKQVFLCGDIINDRSESDAVLLKFFKHIRTQAELANRPDPFVITLSNHDLGIVSAIFRDTNFGKMSVDYKSSQIPHILSNAPTSQDYLEYLQELQLFYYDPDTKFLLSHAMPAGEEEKAVARLKRMAEDRLGHLPANAAEMNDFVKFCNTAYRDFITRISEPNVILTKQDYNRYKTFFEIAWVRGRLEQKGDHLFGSVVETHAHGHDTSSTTNKYRNSPDQDVKVFDLQNTDLLE